MSIITRFRNQKLAVIQSIPGNLGKYLVFLVTFVLSACGTATQIPTATAPPTQTPSPSLTATITPTPNPPTPSLSPTVLVPTYTPEPQVCSPITEVEIPDLAGLIFNRFAPPPLGSDDPHQGVDFAVIDPTSQIALEGRPVKAVLGGRVAAVINDRFPYGNAIIIETPLDSLKIETMTTLQIPTPAPRTEGHPSLTCPSGEDPPAWDDSNRSLYLIYAHLEEPPAYQVGDPVVCGQTLGAIGNSGNSLNPHVHLELRAGPSGASFDSMAHYTGHATPQEMYNYCLWRVSEAFQLLDPMLLFELKP